MKIEIMNGAVAELRLDLNKFKATLCKGFDLENSVKGSLKVVNNAHPRIHDKAMIEYVFLSYDWGKAIDNLKDNEAADINFRIFEVNYTDWVRFTPGVVSEDGRTFKLTETKQSGTDVMVISDLLNHPSTIINNYICNGQFRYGMPKHKWSATMELK